MTEPTDAEISDLYAEQTGFDLNESPAALLDFARAVLAKWGTPPAEQPAPNTGHAEADRLIGRLMSSDPDFEDCRQAAELIQREIKGPDGFGTWREAAIAERLTRVNQQAAPKAAQGVGNSGFDYKTAADFLNGKTVSDEAVRKFVAASRWAHDERAALSATLLAMHGVLTSREAEIALLKKALLEAETAPQPTQPQAGAVPLTDEQRSDIATAAAGFNWTDDYVEAIDYVIDGVESLHGIKGDQQ